MGKIGYQNQKPDLIIKKKITPLKTFNANKLTREEKDKIYELFEMVESNKVFASSTINLQKKVFLSQNSSKSPSKFNKFIEESK